MASRPTLLDPNRSGSKNRKMSQKQEDSCAKDIGGRKTPGSGNTWHKKGDVQSPELLVECKATAKISFTLTLADLKKAYLESVAAGKMMIFQVQFGDGSKWAIQRWEDLDFAGEKAIVPAAPVEVVAAPLPVEVDSDCVPISIV